MKRWYWLLILALAAESIAAGLPGMNGTGNLLRDGGIGKFEWVFVRKGWNGTARMNAKNFAPAAPAQTGMLAGRWIVPDGTLDCRLTLRELSGHAVEFNSAFVAEKPLDAAMLALVLTLPASESGGDVELDGKIVPLPGKVGASAVVCEEREVRRRTFRFQDGDHQLTISGVFGIRIQDDRKYRQNQYSIRFLPAHSEGRITRSELALLLTDEQPVSRPVDLRKAANMGFRDEAAEDGKGGWSDQGPDNDLAMISAGIRTFSGIRYEVIDPAQNDGKSCLVLADPAFRRYPAAGSVTPTGEGAAEWLYLLHASAWTPKFNAPIGTVRVEYADGKTQEITVLSGRDCGNWWRPAALPNGMIAYSADRNGERVGLYSSGFRLNGKEPRRITFVPAGHTVWMIVGVSLADRRILQSRPEAQVLREGKNWAKLETGNVIHKGSPLDLSGWLDAPAGKYGRVVIRDGKFVFADRPEQRLRFVGVNLCHQHCYMSRETVDAIVERITRLGYNSVRLHHIDRKILDPKADNTTTFSPEKLDQLFYLFAKCKQAGLYVCIDLYSMRPIKPGDGIVELPAGTNGAEIKTLIPLSPSAMNSWKAYAKKLMTLRNPYTGMTLAEDPALYSLNLVNEASLPAGWNRYPALIPVVDAAYAGHLRKLGRYTPERAAARGPEFFRFLVDKEAEALTELIRFTKAEIGFPGAVTNYNYNAWDYELPLRDKLDFVDNHSYQDHPTYPQKSWQLPAVFRQVSSLEEWGRTPGLLAPSRQFGKPYTITEMQFCNPNIFRGEAGTVFAAVAALQDYDGYYRFSYADSFEWGVPKYFAQDNEPVSQLTEKMLHFLFGRGDIAPAREAVAMSWDDSLLERLQNLSTPAPADFGKLALYGRIGSRKSGAAPTDIPAVGGDAWENELPVGFRTALKTIRTGGKLRSSTGEIEVEPGKRSIRIVTPKSEAFTLENGSLSGNAVTVSGADRFQTVSAHSLDGAPLTQSRSILLLHITNTAATGMQFHDASRRMLEKWGSLPLLVEIGEVQIVLRNANGGKMKVEKLAWDGSTVGRQPAEFSGGELRFPITTAQGIMAYHIVRKD